MKIGNLECYGVIYKITNKVNGKVYIGQTSKSGGFKKRYDYGGDGIIRVYKYHKNHKKYNKTHNEHLLNSMNKHGIENFEVNEIFDIAFSKQELDAKEKSWIAIYNSIDRRYGYNFCDGGSNGKPTREVIEKNRLSKIGKNLKSENPNSRTVICLTTNKIFGSTIEGAEYYNINRTAISQACTGKRTHAGYLKDKTKLIWMYYDEYLKNKIEVEKRLKSDYTYKKRNSRKVICITTNKVFNKIKDAANYYNISNSANITSCCKGKLNYCGRLEDGTKLKWEYYKG